MVEVMVLHAHKFVLSFLMFLMPDLFAAHGISQHSWKWGIGMGMGKGRDMGKGRACCCKPWGMGMGEGMGMGGGVHKLGLQACTLSCIALVDISYHTTVNQALVL